MVQLLELITRTSVLGLLILLVVLLPFIALSVALIIAFRRRESVKKKDKRQK